MHVSSRLEYLGVGCCEMTVAYQAGGVSYDVVDSELTDGENWRQLVEDTLAHPERGGWRQLTIAEIVAYILGHWAWSATLDSG